MKIFQMKLTIVSTIAIMLLVFPVAWSQMGGGGGMMGGGGGGGMMGVSGRMGQLKIADLDGDNVPEIVTIIGGTYLVIMDNEGNVKSTKPLPLIPGQTTYQGGNVSNLDIADLDGDGIPEIVLVYHLGNYGMHFGFGTPATNGTYLVILDNQGNLKDYKLLQGIY